METFISTKNVKDKDKLYQKLDVVKNRLKQSTIPENLVKSTIINYIINSSKISSLSKDKEAKEMAKEFIQYFPNKDVIELSLDSLNKHFKNSSPSVIVKSFKQEINKEKNYLEFYFKIVILLQNINDIKEAINNQLDVKNNYIKELLEK